MLKATPLTQQLLFADTPLSLSKKEKKRPRDQDKGRSSQLEALMKRYPKFELKSASRQLDLSFYRNKPSAEKEEGPLV
jgi:hypothetical protein